jgi:hypothetical protein
VKAALAVERFAVLSAHAAMTCRYINSQKVSGDDRRQPRALDAQIAATSDDPPALTSVV